MDSRGDMILFAISAKRQLSWQAFVDVLDAIFVPDSRLAPDVKHVRSSVATLGDSLGHWEVVQDGPSARICVAPPVIARLPRPGRPTAILCGSRSPDTLPAITNACQNLRVEVQVFSQSQQHAYAASRVELSADSSDEIADAARALNIAFRPVPPAWTLAAACGSVGDYTASVRWESEPELNWPRRDFDTQRLCFVRGSGDPAAKGLNLTAYDHPSGWAHQDRLWRGKESAIVDRDWGRYAVLAARGITVIGFDHRRGTVSVPRQVPLPRIVARSLGLCSGRPPTIKPGEGLGAYIYSDVPITIFEGLAVKLGQLATNSIEETKEAEPL